MATDLDININWDDYRFFLALARAGSLKGAARLLATDQTTVGRRVYALEDKLGTRLFEKRSDGFFLTVFGERIKTQVEEAESSLLTVQRSIFGQNDKLEGTIKIAMPGALANHLIIPKIKAFVKDYPAIKFQFLTGAEVLNLAKREADMAFRFVHPQQADLIVKKVGELRLGLYVSRAFRTQHAQINELGGLKEIPFISIYSSSQSEAEKKLLRPLIPFLKPTIESAAWSSVYSAVRSGLGIGVLPSFLAEQDPSLEVLDFVKPQKMPLWWVVHPEVQKNARVEKFSQYMIPILKALI